MKSTKNLVSSSGECHQANPLTGFTQGLTGSAERVRLMGNGAQLRNMPTEPSGSSPGQFVQPETVDFYDMRSGFPAPRAQSSHVVPTGPNWADQFSASVQLHPMARPRRPMFAPMMPPMMAPVYTPPQHGSAAPDDLAAAKRMVELMRNSGNPKFANSTFVDFIDQVASGELRFEGGAVVDRAGEPVDWEAVYEDGQMGDSLASAGDDAEGLPDQMERIWQELRQDNAFLTESAGEYEFQHSSNRFIESAENLLEVAVRLMAEGRDSEALEALEAEVRVNPESSEGWRLLGQLHAQFDRDSDAIKCLEKGHSCDEFNLNSLLALGVSLTNELDSVRALKILKKWISKNEKFHHIRIPFDSSAEASMPDFDFTRLKREVLGLFTAAAQVDPSDFDVAVALGVVHNIGRDYALAIDSLLRAVELRPSDFAAWNKLGASLANSGLSQESLLAYHQALALKPGYARAWSNLAIAHSNLGEYGPASKFFHAALQLSPGASHLWSSLFLALSNFQPENVLLGDLVERRDVEGLLGAIEGAIRVSQLPQPTQPVDVVGTLTRLRQALRQE